MDQYIQFRSSFFLELFQSLALGSTKHLRETAACKLADSHSEIPQAE